MSIKDLFYRNKKYKVVTSSSLDTIGNKVESHEYVQEYHKERSRYIPTVDFGNPEEFSFYGSAEEYYKSTIKRIYQQYPYDGSLKEKLAFQNSSSYMDKWFFENEYPRTNGFISVGQNWGNSDLGSVTSFTADSNDYSNDTFKVSPKPQFVFIKGGPNGPTIRPYDGKTVETPDYKNPLHKSNIFSPGRDLESNLQIDGVSGSTVEFWFKAGSDLSNSDKFLGPSPNVALFDLWNSSSLTAQQDNPSTYGRLLVEMRRDASDLSSFKGDSLFYFTVMSGNSGIDRAPIGSTTLTSDYNLADWNHYAFTFINNDSSTSDKQIDLKLYINGHLKETVITGSSIGEITQGPHLANIGAYIYAPNTASVSGFTAGGRNQEGIGCVSGSFDEFRFWKEKRDSERIFQHYNSQIGGGTNTDPANNHLGVYYKFNEGVTETGSIDQNILDYSGRVSNGLFKNYDSTLTMRSTGSAMVQAGSASAEFKDPIIYSYHPEVQSTEEQYILKGAEYDYRNSNMLFNSLPDWIINDDSLENNTKNLFQIISSYFDQLHSMISDVPRLKDIRYASGSTQRPLPFANELLESAGFFAPEIFPNATILNNFLDRDENGLVYEKNIHDIKNFIYENIYHNLSYINKTKGTSKSIRNLIRCFGVDDELYKINIYSDGMTYKPENGYTDTTRKINYADFAHVERNDAVVFQSTASSNSNSSGYLNHSSNDTAGFDSDTGMTFESDVYFPHPPDIGDPNFTSGSFGYLSSSLFGAHTAKTSAADLDWASNDYGNFQVYAVRDESKIPNSKNAYFQLKSTTGGLLAGGDDGNDITSSIFYDVYDNKKWNFAVVVKPAEYPNSTYVSGTTDDYVVEFHGYSFLSDMVVDSFVVTSSITGQSGRRFVSSKKRFYAGAHRQNFIGAVLNPSDVRVSNCKIWTIPLGGAEITAHGRDATNFGVTDPEKGAYLNENKSTFSGLVPRIKTLALHWDFSNVSGSTDDGEFLVEDLSSGSSDNRFGDWSAILEKQHTGQGMFFKSNDTDSVSKEYVPIAKTQFIENLNNENFVQILEKDDEFFGVPRARPVRYFFTIEKSMYQSINEEMIDLFASLAGLQSYASLIGQPVDKYRGDYKNLRVFRNLFFDKVNNEPDLEKFVKFYKWFDESIEGMILNLIPASSNFGGVLNTVESHILERNKYRHKFPTIDSKLPDITGSIEGINRHKYNWKFGHAPTPPDAGGSAGNSPGNQNQNTLWWKQRAERNTDAPSNFTTSNDGVDNTRGFIHSATLATFNRHLDRPFDFNVLEFRKEGPKNYRAFFPHLQYDSTNVIEIKQSSIPDSIAFSGSDDHKELYPPKKFKAALYGKLNSDGGDTHEGEEVHNHLFPFNMYSSSLGTKISREFKEGLIITDQHRDTYHTFENEPLQGPFTNTHVGGNQHRHISLNKGDKENLVERNRDGRLDDDEIRPEAWRIMFDSVEPPKQSAIGAIGFMSDTANLYGSSRFTIVSTDGTSKRYIFDIGGSAGTGTLDGSDVVVQVNGLSDRDDIADQLIIAINSSNGHNGGTANSKISLSYSDATNTLTLTQVVKGVAGNTTIVPELQNSVLSFTNFSGGGGTNRIRLVSPDFDGTDKPRASYLRDETAKRPVNIRNIQYTTASQDLGNFTKNYEVVMTSGRNINNHYFKENLGVSVTGSHSTLVSGTSDFTLPDRTQDANKTRTVISERFSAPGDPATLGRGFLDVESETFSVYNNLNYRNFTVRNRLHSMLTASVVEFGLAEAAHGEQGEDKNQFRRATFHKVNKNSVKRIELKELRPDGNGDVLGGTPASSTGDDDHYQTGTLSDNYYVQHQIPRSVMQYSWISASAVTGPFGFEKPNPAYASMASDDITFIDSSQIGSVRYNNSVRLFGQDKQQTENVNYKDHQPSAFIPLNINFYNVLDTSTNTLVSSFPNGADLGATLSEEDGSYLDNIAGSSANSVGVHGANAFLNANLLRNNGPYGYPSWKQWRGGEHQIARYNKKNNIISVAVQRYQELQTVDNKKQMQQKELLSITEAPVNSCYKPLVHSLNLKVGGGVDVKSTYGGRLRYPLDQKVTGDNGEVSFLEAAGISPPSPPIFDQATTALDELGKLYITNEVPDDANPLVTMDKNSVNPSDYRPKVANVRFSQCVFPPSSRTYLNSTRTRTAYSQTREQFSTGLFGQQRAFWRDAHVDRLRTDSDSTLNSFGFKIDKDATKGFPHQTTSTVSGGILVVNRVSPSPSTTVTASGGSAALSIWPLDTDGEGSAIYGYVSTDNDDGSSHAPKYYIGRGAGELSHSDDWTLYYKDYAPTASISYTFMQQLHFSGAYQTNDSGDSFGQANKSVKLPKYQTPELIGSKPWFDSYEEFAEDIRPMAKDHTILPEFAISNHMDFYIKQGTFAVKRNDLFELKGASGSALQVNFGGDILTSSAPAPTSIDEKFSSALMESQKLDYFKPIRDAHTAAEMPEQIFTLSFDSVMKMLPYQGFYPALRTTQLASLLSQSYGAHLGPTNTNDWPAKPDGLRTDGTRLASFMQPFFAPGIMFNTIKSGIAVDWPLFRGAYEFNTSTDGSAFRGAGFISGSEDNPSFTVGGAGEASVITSHGGPNARMPFEALLEPESFLEPSGVLDAGKYIHLGPQWNQFGYRNGSFLSGSDGKAAAGGVLEPASVSFTFTGTPSNGRTIGIESILGTKITGTVNTGVGTSTNSVIAMDNISSTTDVAERFYNFVSLATANVSSLAAFHAGNVVTLYSANGDLANGLDITDANTGSTFINNVTIGPVASSSAGVKFTGGQKANVSYFEWKGDNEPKYTIAMHNFLAEIPNFFLTDNPLNSNLTSFQSGPQSEWDGFQGGKKYYMDVVLQKSDRLSMFEGPAAFQAPGARINYTGSAKGIHYGPAMRWTNTGSAGKPADSPNSSDEFIRNMADPAFAPYTPPYFYGTSIARLEFDPLKVDTNLGANAESFDIDDIIAGTTVHYINQCESHPEFAQLSIAGQNTSLHENSANTPASASFMHLSSSINLFGKATEDQLKFANLIGGFLTPTSVEEGQDPKWIISTKFECPVLNFSGNAGPAKGTQLSNLTSLERACFDSKGMWYGSGSVDRGGLTLSLKESYPDLINQDDSTKLSLLQTCKFANKTKKRIGQIKAAKTISEAIVAIPYDVETGKFIPISLQSFSKTAKNISNGQADARPEQFPELTKEIEQTSIGKMLRKMREYVIPPHLDFTNPKVFNPELPEESMTRPFVMYIMEFNHTLDREDLQNIWQNVMPKIAKTAKKSNRTISHQVGVPWEFFDTGLPKKEFKFKVFKVKKRASNNYFALNPSAKSKKVDHLSEATDFNFESKVNLPYSFNWPYDFFSLVETGKLDTKVDFREKEFSVDSSDGTGARRYTLYKDEQINTTQEIGDES